MPPRQWRLFVADIIDAIEAIDGYTAGLTGSSSWATACVWTRSSRI